MGFKAWFGLKPELRLSMWLKSQDAKCAGMFLKMEKPHGVGFERVRKSVMFSDVKNVMS